MFRARLHDKASGVVGGVDGSVGEGNMELLVDNGEIVYFGEVLMNKGDGGPRVDHGIDREGGPLEVK
ncbi:hypothetical protein BGZ67_008328, partial [Mortierella alpina]